MSFVADNKGIVLRVASMACRMSILRLWHVAVSKLRIACVAVSNLVFVNGYEGSKTKARPKHNGFTLMPLELEIAVETYTNPMQILMS